MAAAAQNTKYLQHNRHKIRNMQRKIEGSKASQPVDTATTTPSL